MVTVSYTPAYQVILTRRCAFECSYCNFPHTPSPPPPSPKAFRAYLRSAQRLGAWEVTLSAAEGVDRLTEIESTMRYYGFHDWYSYLEELCRLTLEARGAQPLTPVLDVGPLPTRILRRLASIAPAIRLLLDTSDPALSTTVHANAPQKSPLLRSLALKDICRAGIPLITGTRIGIGESTKSWVQTIETINELQDEYGNITAFHLLPFAPQPFSAMANNLPMETEKFKQAIAVARNSLHKSITLVAEVHQRFALAPEAVISGVFSLGPVRIATNERIDIELINSLKSVKDVLARINVHMKPTPVIPESYAKCHRLPDLVAHNLMRFEAIGSARPGDTPAHGSQLACT